jgi:hypothetical protein
MMRIGKLQEYSYFDNPKLLTLGIRIVIVFALGISIGIMDPNLGALRFIVTIGSADQSGLICCIYS